MSDMRTIADILDSHPRNDIEALWLVVGGWFLIAIPADPQDIWAIYWGYVLWAAYTLYRWYLRERSAQDWPPPAESTAEWPSK